MSNAAVTLPLDGYTRPGRFFPIVLDGQDARSPQDFSAVGCMDCQLQSSDASRRVVPMLAIATAKELHWVDGSTPLRTLADNERLVASTDAELDRTLFPETHEILIRLDPADPLPGPPVAWETLDAVLLDSTMFQRIDDAQRSALLAAGVMLIARGDMPDQRWPWKLSGSRWILSSAADHPCVQSINADAYSPTFNWTPGWSPRVRGQVVGVATLLILVTAGVLAIRKNRWTVGLAIAFSFLAAGGIASWHHSLGNIDRCGGDILIPDAGLLQQDSWVYQRAKTDSSTSVPWTGSTHPIFASAKGITQTKMQLQIAGNGGMSFIYQASASWTMAFVRSEVQPRKSSATAGTHESPMQEIARSVYLSPGWKIAGELPATTNRWPAVAITR